MPHHGAMAPRGLEAAGAARSTRGRFGRMFGYLPARDPGEAAIIELARTMTDQGSDNNSIPAGFTYFAQFIDHDITFDPTSQLQRDNDPYALVNFRTPRLDLDSVYGSGPLDQPFLYDEDGVKLLVGRGEGGHDDLPRNDNGRALIGDPRNDEHLIIAQLHLLFIRFHNRLVDWMGGRGDDVLPEAQRLVRWHFQWIVVHEFLERIVGTDMAAAVRAERRFYRWDHEPFVPVEFSAAAFRFGHSMVRETYTLSGKHGDAKPILPPAATTPSGEHLGGFRRLPAEFVIEWPRFFELNGMTPQPSRTIDTGIASRLRMLPEALSRSGDALPRLNLLRGAALGLPSGTAVARAMGETPLTVKALNLPAIEELQRSPPLWHYILSEAASELGEGGRRLGPVGGRIVGEVLVGLVDGDPSSYLRQWPEWTPELAGGRERDFTMADLIEFTG